VKGGTSEGSTKKDKLETRKGRLERNNFYLVQGKKKNRNIDKRIENPFGTSTFFGGEGWGRGEKKAIRSI